MLRAGNQSNCWAQNTVDQTFKLALIEAMLKTHFSTIRFNKRNKNITFANNESLALCYYHFTYAFLSESKLCSYLNVKHFLAWNRRGIWNLSDSYGIRTHNHIICKRTFNYLPKLAKRLSCVVSTCLYVHLTVCYKTNDTIDKINDTKFAASLIETEHQLP